MVRDPQTRGRGGNPLTLLLGLLLALIGLALTGGGGWLLALGGSPYYLAAGIGLLLAGGLIVTGRAAGAWLYILVFLGTLAWAFWEVGLDKWALVPRLVGPLLLLILVVLALPGLTPGRYRFSHVLGAVSAILLLALLGGAGIAWWDRPPAPAALPPSGRQAMDDPAPLQPGADWPAYGGSYSARRYSPLNQITPDNVGTLQRAWLYHTGDVPQSDLAKNKYGAETTPLKIGDALYLCTAKNILIRLDAATGKQVWRHDPRVPDAAIPYTAACRGVAYYAVPPATTAENTPAPLTPAQRGLCAERIIEGTLDARLIAVDAATGQPCTGFGTNGTVDLTAGMGEVVPGMVSVTSPPTIVRGVVVLGHQVLDGQKRSAPSGVIRGYDAVTGELRWAWDMARPDLTGLPVEGDQYTRGTPNMWTTASGDEELGLVYLPMGNSAVDYWSGSRTEAEKRFSTSLVALDVTSGHVAWSFQTVHNDVWDYDLGSQATLVDFNTANGPVPALVLPSKQGDIYILDRRTGQPLTPVEERPVPQGGVEPEQRSPTQPFSLYHTLRKPDLTERDMWGMSPIDQMICRIQFRQAYYQGFYTPPTSGRHSIEYPGYNGGSDWGGVAVDPVHGLIIANYNDMPNHNELIPRAEADRLGWAPRGQERGGDMGSGAEGAGDPQAGTPYAINVNAGWRLPLTGLLCKQPPYGGIRAIDLASGKTLWDRPFGTARRNGPFGIPSGLPFEIGTPNNGGAVVTAGGLIFIAAATDNLIRAIDLRSGETVWQDTLPAGGQATPMTYEIEGRQYLVIMAGGHHFMETPIGDELIAYALPPQ
ncbi:MULTISPECIES: membrane-bound PQQ-dependent dehydrogenase, glucose/quinate/shikimate family [unclassified Azospirillum]|uniref:membrane-bound PQQ-dependent dehydrogenase, glucose/quinate/shikimate family n=1 Tax=unclassified Azospirillum TaxID=2630922 RepID=UPI000B647B12|nr:MULTISPECIES: membrane-bound PQQ-dependent dehydrogenase, glucose/quinate/shikimate family [unclassified Azospirillum]SNS72974.1 quinoprotein glucose dehydrogenase [Azospirillum sp. RU38E]SNS90830.1 quinoprotein glucose dehydrogenase [Azospirillum sp. RU37A]